MDTSELMEEIKKGFKDQNAKFDEKFDGLRGEFDEKFGGLRGEFDEKFGGLRGEFDKLRNEFGGLKASVTEIKDGFDQTHILIENLRRDLKIFDEDTSKDGPIPLARRVTSLEGRVTKLEKRR